MGKVYAIGVARVSTLKQDEKMQIPDIEDYSARKNYDLDAVVPIHGKSAFHGKHLKMLYAVINEHIVNGRCVVLVLWKVDRLSRQGNKAVSKLRSYVEEHGGRIEVAKQEFLNQTGMGAEIAWTALSEVAMEESQIKSDRRKMGHAKSRENGTNIGCPPWGYKSIKLKLTPTELGRKWIPFIFHSSANGKSLRWICNEMNAKNVPTATKKSTAWSDRSIKLIIENPTYFGGRPNRGNMEYDALVTYSEWVAANKALRKRAKLGRGTKRKAPALLRPICGACHGVKRDGCPNGISPMYRTGSGQNMYYVCRGRGSANKSCGTSQVKLPALDARVNEIMSQDTSPHTETRYVVGVDYTAEILRLNNEMSSAAQKADYGKVQELMDKVKSLKTAQDDADNDDDPGYCEVDTGMTEGAYWQTLDDAGKREELLHWDVIAWVDPAGDLMVKVEKHKPVQKTSKELAA
jgi:DNA invertase Pin-like site-specific DNA recombinase